MASRSWLTGFLLPTLAACGASGTNAPNANEASAPSSNDPATPGAAPSENGGSSEAPPELPGAPPVTDVGWDFHAWAYSRELKVELTSDGCEPAKLGEKPEETVWCGQHAESKEGAVLYSRTLYVARNKQLVKLVELTVAAGVVDNPEAPKDERDRQVIRLDIVPSGDGKKLEAREAPGFDCDKALKGNDENKASAKDLTRALDERIRKVCATRGEWVWTAGTLHRGAKR
jgi:hypothetical protein